VGTPPLTGVAVNVTGVPAQTGPAGFAAILTLAATGGLTSITIWLDKTGLPVTQAREEVIDTVIISLSFSAEDEYVELLLPTATPFNLHSYEGDPPLTGTAVKATIVPAQTGPEGAADILTPAAPGVVTDIVMALDVAVPVLQRAEEVITTLTTSLFVSVEEVNTGLLTPTFIPFTLHWYDGVRPPFTGVAVKVTEVPAHMLPAGKAAIVTPGVTKGVTDIMI
jgi:hypothetical protein